MDNQDVEKEANYFALMLLMPRDLLMRELLKYKGIDLSGDGNELKEICKTFDVSLTALTVRLSLLTKEDRRTLGLL